MLLFKQFNSDTLEELQNFVLQIFPQNLLTESNEGRVNRFGIMEGQNGVIATIHEVREKLHRSSIFLHFLKSFNLNLGMVTHTQFTIAPPSITTQREVHIDGKDGTFSPLSLNVPIIAADDTYVEYWKCDSSAKNAIYPWGKDKKEIIYRIFDENDCEYVDAVSRNKITVLRTDVPHSVISSKEKLTLQLLLRLDKRFISKIEEF